MTSELQRGALKVLAEVWALAPDVRLGQLMAHVGFLGEDQLGRGLGCIDDDEIVAILYRHRSELLARSQTDLGQPQKSPTPVAVFDDSLPITGGSGSIS